MRIGLFGGTFDPPHLGHLLAASDAFEALELDQLVFIPAATQPFKIGQVTATAAQRLAMVRLLVGGDPRFAVDPIEIEREGLSYTVDTVAEYASRYPEARRYLLVGADVPGSFKDWREPQRILDLAELVVLARAPEGAGPGGPMGGAQGASAGIALGDRVIVPRSLGTRRIDISSTEIRARLRAGRAIRGFVPEALADYILAAALYR